MEEQLHYGEKELSFQVADYGKCCEFIDSHIVNDKECTVIKFNKNDKIKKKIDQLLKLFQQDDKKDKIYMIAYGVHLQKLLTIWQIAKKKIFKKGELAQFNRLDNFVCSETKDLVTKKKLVPILIVTVVNKENDSNYNKQL